MSTEDEIDPLANPTEVEVLLKDLLSWFRQPSGSMAGYPRFESAGEWEEWFERGSPFRERALEQFTRLAEERTGGVDGP
jgi:hypothetical protein